MPGIAGIISNVLTREVAAEQLRRMLGVLRHESFYVCGSWFDERAGIYVGWTAIDKAAGSLPFRNEQGDRTLVFSGEEFPEPGTSHALRSRGHEFDQAEQVGSGVDGQHLFQHPFRAGIGDQPIVHDGDSHAGIRSRMEINSCTLRCQVNSRARAVPARTCCSRTPGSATISRMPLAISSGSRGLQ